MTSVAKAPRPSFDFLTLNFEHCDSSSNFHQPQIINKIFFTIHSKCLYFRGKLINLKKTSCPTIRLGLLREHVWVEISLFTLLNKRGGGANERYILFYQTWKLCTDLEQKNTSGLSSTDRRWRVHILYRFAVKSTSSKDSDSRFRPNVKIVTIAMRRRGRKSLVGSTKRFVRSDPLTHSMKFKILAESSFAYDLYKC